MSYPRFYTYMSYPRVYTSIVIFKYYYTLGLPLEKLACHMRVASINTRVHLPLTLKIINRDYLRFVKPLTIPILTVSISSTLETALFH